MIFRSQDRMAVIDTGSHTLIEAVSDRDGIKIQITCGEIKKVVAEFGHSIDWAIEVLDEISDWIIAGNGFYELPTKGEMEALEAYERARRKTS